MVKPKDEYKEPITIEYPGMVVRVFSPLLDSEERQKRMQNIHKETINIFKVGVKK